MNRNPSNAYSESSSTPLQVNLDKKKNAGGNVQLIKLENFLPTLCFRNQKST